MALYNKIFNTLFLSSSSCKPSIYSTYSLNFTNDIYNQLENDDHYNFTSLYKTNIITIFEICEKLKNSNETFIIDLINFLKCSVTYSSSIVFTGYFTVILDPKQAILIENLINSSSSTRELFNIEDNENYKICGVYRIYSKLILPQYP